MIQRIQINNLRLSYEEFKKEMNAAYARAEAANLLADNSDERFEQLVDRMQVVFDHSDSNVSEQLNVRRAWGQINRNVGETELRVPHREPNPAFVNFDWTKPKPEIKVFENKGPILRKPVKKVARDYHCGIPAVFCDDLKETIHSIVGHDVNLGFFDVDETDDFFN